MDERARWATRGVAASLLLAGVVVGCGGRAVDLLSEGGPDASTDGHGRDANGRDVVNNNEGSPPVEGGHQTATKVDLLFDIDNSASMGDKQAYLANAIPDLVSRLVNPKCLLGGKTVGSSSKGSCAAFPGSTIEFPPVHDMHIGVISSSLGTRGVTGSGAVCDPSQMTQTFTSPPSPAISAHTDDRGELLSRTSDNAETEGKSPDVGGQGFLDWFPNVPANAGKSASSGPQALAPHATAITDDATLESDFQALVIGAHFYGCGIESQLESFYRFLVQPDPYDSIVRTGGLAQWNGVDATIIKQRHDFLRPDSLVAIIDLSDENDSEIDVRAFGGQGYTFMDASFQPPRGTSECATSPGSPKCTSCAYGGLAKDPSCKKGPYTAEDDPGFYINVRHVHMQQKYGIVPQFPLQRYVLGLTSARVPDRDHEYPKGAPSYKGGTSADPDDLNCTNPLFAASLPNGLDMSPSTLCNLAGAGGPRGPELIFYAHIGGVPHQLLQVNPSNPNSPQKDTLTASDWQKILGTNPDAYDYSGIDPHMIESFGPRTGLVALTTGPGPKGGGADPINGGEWVTDGLSPLHTLPVDREYACIFPLTTPRDCTNGDYATQEQCDCSLAGLPLVAVPAVCGLKDPTHPYSTSTNDYTTQYYAKAYPTIRELELAQLLGPQGVVSSLCPIHVDDNSAGNDPLFGYRPAVAALVSRMKAALTAP